ncbi:GNAT family N-acetyltransferase [Acidomonas methanolica]|uniref:Acetyltransferase n=1 Tax=Acidomonas methanolica NBRC 104435 TaxID=1231351 RepID=A0A023D6D5_ACIMT|nr:GNAT family N-acetyltransferase [Acidomonas methanolica]MBU2655438.1 GNAT family N-acetyltransferase [Acidomonas methanolica]TCS23321.1 acetyltransferase (GNAT) family protein [Acidomonas methanolica]GAJ29692.1 acetyltransferase [Acidomonas methanolica NBRC 104435]GBQ48788.1 acetyltransferase [Acidomonas methanolica]GEL00264.1 GNAT family acetyltransferase [Acidomonas methanolica NBRC 104435]
MGRLTIERCPRDRLDSVLDDLARLRIAVFRAWPYLYDGDDPEYERRYLEVYRRSPKAAVILARDGETIVGASTCLPMADEGEAMRAPFVRRGLDLDPIFYFGESVLLPAYRGQGAGVRFFALREAAAREAGARIATFCAVRRPADHPARPAGAEPLDAFWTKRGYIKLSGVSMEYPWKEVGGTGETPHTLDFWARTLDGGALPNELMEAS